MYQISFYKIVEAAIDKMRLRPYQQPLSADQLSKGKRAFNMLIQRWSNHIEFHWMEEVFRQKCSTGSLVLHNAVVYTCRLGHVGAAANEPGVGADWEQFWYTGGDEDTTTVWVSGSTFTSGNYYDLGLLDEDIIQVNNVRVLYNEEFSPVEIVETREDFENNYEEYGVGKPERIWIDYKNTQNDTTPKAYIYPFPDSSSDYVLYLSTLLKMPEFNSNSEYPGVPAKWISALVYTLASDLAPEFDLPDTFAQKALGFYKDAIDDNDVIVVSITKDGAFDA